MSNAVYSADKPADCAYCYFWRGKKKGCELSSCYYLIQPVKKKLPLMSRGRSEIVKAARMGGIPRVSVFVWQKSYRK